MLGHEERDLVKTNWNISKSEVGGGLSVWIESRFWVNINWYSLVLGRNERNLIESEWHINKAEVGCGLCVCVKGRFWIDKDWDTLSFGLE